MQAWLDTNSMSWVIFSDGSLDFFLSLQTKVFSVDRTSEKFDDMKSMSC